MGRVLCGALLGPVALSLLKALTDWLFARSVFNDGLYALVFAVTIPSGVVLGALTGWVSALASRQRRTAGAWAMWGGGLGVVSAVLLTGLWAQGGSFGEAIGFFVFYPGLAALWSAALLAWGLWTGRRPGSGS